MTGVLYIGIVNEAQHSRPSDQGSAANGSKCNVPREMSGHREAG
jgi:hypothetical protein